MSNGKGNSQSGQQVRTVRINEGIEKKGGVNVKPSTPPPPPPKGQGGKK